MAKTNQDLNNALQNKDPAKFQQLDVQAKLDKWKEHHLPKLASLAGNKETAEKVYVICMNTIGKNPSLLECTFESIANCILQSFQLGLYPGPFQECGYVPLRNGRATQRAGREVVEANFWPQYQGIVKLMRNAGNKTIIARVVCKNDHFEYFEGDKPPVYAPAVVLGKKRGEPLFAYAAVLTREGAWQVEVMDLEQIETIKSRSRGAQKNDSPWNSKYDDDRYTMWAKTCLKRVSKWCTKSAELVEAIESDNKVDGDPTIDNNKLSLLSMAVNGGDAPNVPLAPAQEDDNSADPSPVGDDGKAPPSDKDAK